MPMRSEKKKKTDLKEGVREGKWCHLNSWGYPLPFKSKAGRGQQPKTIQFCQISINGLQN